jgi:hypothetical protein
MNDHTIDRASSGAASPKMVRFDADPRYLVEPWNCVDSGNYSASLDLDPFPGCLPHLDTYGRQRSASVPGFSSGNLENPQYYRSRAMSTLEIDPDTLINDFFALFDDKAPHIQPSPVITPIATPSAFNDKIESRPSPAESQSIPESELPSENPKVPKMPKDAVIQFTSEGVKRYRCAYEGCTKGNMS